MTGDERRARLARARLYLCVGIRDTFEWFLDAVLGAGVDVVQLREKHAGDLAVLRAAEAFRRAADRHGALFVLNDRADLAVAAAADGVHVGQEDTPPDRVRAIVGDDLLVGRSTHSPEELRRAHAEPVDYLGVGPVYATPTKPGRLGVGLDLVRLAAKEATLPWFVTGGMDERTLPEAIDAGLRRAVVVRAVTEAADPVAAVRRILAALDAVPPAG